MDTEISPGRDRWRDTRRSIRFAYAAFLAVPLAALVAMCVFAGTTIGTALAGSGRAPQHGTVLIRIAVVDAIGLVAVLIAVAGMGWFVRRLTRDIATVETAARQFADQQLPQLAERLRRGEEVDVEGELSSPAPTKITEVGRAAGALASLQRKTAAAAAAEASLRSGISQVFVSLARRNQSLLQRQLRQLDELERKAADPGALADLFPLDHLTTRMRRHAEGLIILSGAVPGRAWSNPVPVIDVIRGAIAEVEDYKRVAVVTEAGDTVAGQAVADIIHLLAELIENATLFSPSGTRVEIRAERVGTGFAVEVEDRGLGIGKDDLEVINQRLATPQDFDMANADQLGLFVVGKLAGRHGVRVSLRTSPYGGITAIVVMPHSMVTAEPTAAAPARTADHPAVAGPSGDLLLALTGRKWSRVSPAGSIFRDPPTAISAQAGLIPAQPDSAPRSPVRPIPAAPLPVQADLIRAKPIRAEPIPAEPIPAEPIPAEPIPAEPVTAEPVTAELTSPDRPDATSYEGATPAGLHRGLPRRVRQASLSPHLRNSPARASAPGPEPARSPEQAKSLLASLQDGWERARRAEIPDPRPGAEGLVSDEREAPPEEK